MFNKNFFSIGNREYKQDRKNRLNENTRIEKYKSQIL